MTKKVIAIACVMTFAVLLSACNNKSEQAIVSKTKSTNALIDEIIDYGTVDGCSVKWIRTTNHPNFWMVKCPNSTLTTQYDTGGKSPTRVGAAVSN
jgi:hypothetical protein